MAAAAAVGDHQTSSLFSQDVVVPACKRRSFLGLIRGLAWIPGNNLGILLPLLLLLLCMLGLQKYGRDPGYFKDLLALAGLHASRRVAAGLHVVISSSSI